MRDKNKSLWSRLYSYDKKWLTNTLLQLMIKMGIFNKNQKLYIESCMRTKIYPRPQPSPQYLSPSPVPISLTLSSSSPQTMVNMRLKFNNMFINTVLHTFKSRKTKSKKCKTIVEWSICSQSSHSNSVKSISRVCWQPCSSVLERTSSQIERNLSSDEYRGRFPQYYH